MDIKVPVGSSVSDHVSSKWDIHQILVPCGLKVVLVDLVGQVWNIDSGVGLTRHEELVLRHLWELLVPGVKGCEGILRLENIVSVEVCISPGD